MKKNFTLLVMAFAFLLAACGQAGTPVFQLTPAGTSTQDSANPTAPTQDSASPTALIPTSAPASCVAQSGVFPTPDPTLQAAFPPPNENDWVEGGANARLTITEYSDFQ